MTYRLTGRSREWARENGLPFVVCVERLYHRCWRDNLIIFTDGNRVFVNNGGTDR
jgi:hypothetical protein